MESKQRMILVTGADLEFILSRASSLGVPHLVKQLGGYWADAEQFRAWKAASPGTSLLS